MISTAECSSSFRDPSPPPRSTERAALSRREALEDAELVRRFNAGDEAAFVDIVGRYQHRMKAVALGMLRNHADADEIAQDTFIRAHRGLGQFRGDSSLATWLHRIALNLSRNRYWYFYRRRRHASVSLDGAFSDDNRATFSDLVSCEEPNPARAASLGEFSEVVAVCLDQLPPRQRQILMLRNTHNRSYEEIAAELAIKVGTVKSRIARAREALRVRLTQACVEFGPEAQPLDWFAPVRPSSGIVKLCA